MFTWSKEYDECVECYTQDNPHSAHGLCRKCYMKSDDQKLRKQLYRDNTRDKAKGYKLRYRNSPSGRNKINESARKRYAKKRAEQHKPYKPHKNHKLFTDKDIDLSLMTIKFTSQQKKKLATFTEEEAQKQYFKLLDEGVLNEGHCYEFMTVWKVLQMSGDDLINKIVDDFGEKPQKKKNN